VSRRTQSYAWVVFGATFVTLLLAAGFRSSPGVLIEPLQAEFGWTKADIGLAVSVNVLLFGLMGPFAAALLARFGLRRVVSLALLAIAVGAGLTASIDQRWQLVLLWGVVVGAASGCMATVLAATVANRWFVKRRGLVTGALTAATASGQLIFLPLFGAFVDGPGWRWVSYTVAITALLAIPVVLLFIRDKPEDVGQVAYGAPPGWATPPPPEHPVRMAIGGLMSLRRTGAFWLLFGSFAVCGLSTNGLIQTHFISAAHDHDISNPAALLALIGGFDVIGTLLSGVLTDRYDPRRLLFAYYGLRGLSLLLLQPALSAGSSSLLVFMVFYGLDWVATVPPTVALCREVCGAELATVGYGWVFAGHQVGAAIAAWGAGYLRDTTGSYQAAFLIAGIACLAAAVGTQQISRRDSAVATPAMAAAEA